MKTMTAKTNLPQQCWIHSNMHYLPNSEDMFLPHLPAKYECVLKENSIPYRKSLRFVHDCFEGDTLVEICEYWNSDYGLEEYEISLPLYAKIPDGSCLYCEKNYTGKVPTEPCIEAAEQISAYVNSKAKEYDIVQADTGAYFTAYNRIGDRLAQMIYHEALAEYVAFRSDNCLYGTCKYNIERDGDKFMLLLLDGTDYVTIFNMNKIVADREHSHIHIEVPEHIAGKVIGRNHSRIRYWAETVGVKEIHVIPV